MAAEYGGALDKKMVWDTFFFNNVRWTDDPSLMTKRNPQPTAFDFYSHRLSVCKENALKVLTAMGDHFKENNVY